MEKPSLQGIGNQAAQDIQELQRKIQEHREGNIPEDKFKLFRLTRGVYGQRQPGVQMIRIKIPFGKVTAKQLQKIADVSEKYTNGNLHLTTRQDIQLHYVKIDDSPALWADLESENVTLREACGNTVRNITGSATAGIDPHEPFDISPYAEAMFAFFLRNPICQEMGRKFKIAFSSSEKDSAFTFFHDLGLIPRIKTVDGKVKRGFKVVIAGGLGALSMVAQTVHEFLPEEELLPFAEALVRIFDRYGERASRNKARLKFLATKLGVDKLIELVKEEHTALKAKKAQITNIDVSTPLPPPLPSNLPTIAENERQDYQNWLETNAFEQKQKGFYGVYVIIPLGNLHATEARKLAVLVKKYAADDIRITVDQSLLLKFIRPEALPAIYLGLKALNLHQAGYGSTADITACPGTDTCNLGVSNSTQLATELEKVIRDEYPELVKETAINIKISGCMNSCGQHMAASIGFHGSSIKHGTAVVPAMQVVLGGGVTPDGKGFVAQKILKVPSKRVPAVLRHLLADYEENGLDGEYFNDYTRRMGRRYFYTLLKKHAAVDTLSESEYTDWGSVEHFKLAVGVGECAGVILDMVGSILREAAEKEILAKESIDNGDFADGIYHAYNMMVITAKALLLGIDHQCNTQIGIMRDFDELLIQQGDFHWESSFQETVLAIKKNEPTETFAKEYFETSKRFFRLAKEYREERLDKDKKVIGDY